MDADKKRAVVGDILNTQDNFSVIGRRYGCSRESVRLLALVMGITGRERETKRRDVKSGIRKLLTHSKFSQLVKKWLLEAGYIYCTYVDHEGGRVVEKKVYSKIRCQECACKWQRNYFKNGRGLEALEEYRDKPGVRERMRKYSRDWYARNHEAHSQRKRDKRKGKDK